MKRFGIPIGIAGGLLLVWFLGVLILPGSRPLPKSQAIDMMNHLHSVFMTIHEKGQSPDNFPSLDALLAAGISSDDIKYLREKNVLLHPTSGKGSDAPFLEGHLGDNKQSVRVMLFANGSGTITKE